MRIPCFLLAIGLLLMGCRESEQSAERSPGEIISHWEPRYAKGFSAEHTRSGVIFLHIASPWPGATKTYRYALVPREHTSGIPTMADSLDGIIRIPVQRVILTSTTHIPALESLGLLDHLVGFPGLDYISSPEARIRIEQDRIQELGANEQLNTERVLALDPDLVVGFGVSGAPSSYQALQASSIPVVYNGDWMEEDPLGKAEWITFFGLLFGKEEMAASIFEKVEKDYLHARNLAAGSKTNPTVLSGALYRDIWYLPGGDSWAARFIKDANAQYLWEDTPEKGSLSLSLESVLENGSQADFWISPSQFTSYSEMEEANEHYRQFKAFQNKNIYSYALSTGPGKGLRYFEQGPSRPDLILKDLIYWLHPGLISDYEPVFFKPLH
jgi:iron complex transport system substrate-binding protein